MCCPGRMCMLCTCLIVAVAVVGFLFGFGVFKHGFHKLENSLHAACDPTASSTFCSRAGRPFLGINAPPPF